MSARVTTCLDPVRTRRTARRPTIGVLGLGGLGGSSRVACQLAHGMADEGRSVWMLSSADPWWRAQAGSAVGFVPLSVPREPIPAAAGWVDRLATELVDTVIDRGIRILSVHYGVGLVAAAVEARGRLRSRGITVDVCATLHGTDVTHWGHDPEQGPALARALRACDAVTAVSGWLADQAHRALGLPCRPHVIPNGVDTALFHPAPVACVNPRPVLCHASNMRPVKRPLDAIETLGRLRDQGIDAELMMVGDGPLRAAARERTEALALDDRVDFVPPVSPPQLARMLRSVDLSLVTSTSESFGLFALESMASGVPVLSTRCGGLQEVFDADPSGELSAALLADIGDTADLARRAAAFLGDPTARRRLGQRAQAVGRHRFPRARQLAGFETMFGRLTAQRAP